AQQILNIGGQNILVSGSGPGTVGSASVRYGKILKGVHKYFCSKCQRPFTQKESLTRHEQENCPAIPKEQKKKYKCDQCEKIFSSKQYLREHIHIVHLQKFLYFCKGCNKGFFKHCKLAHHNKSCLAVLVPGLANPASNPVVNTPTTSATDTTTTTTTTSTTSTTQSTESENRGDPLIGGSEGFEFSNPMFLPDLNDQ
ncbi:MAG: hypothetical protein MJE68_21720, partial [Proteobacteria bacterium]|nr:hypothetical protein [Pseudomonadota bacterium]